MFKAAVIIATACTFFANAAQISTKSFYCLGKNDGCRSDGGGRRLGRGDGDCDKNSDCLWGLRCGRNNCDKKGWSPFNWDDDCCYDDSKDKSNKRMKMP